MSPNWPKLASLVHTLAINVFVCIHRYQEYVR